MQEYLYNKMYEVESTHWWFQAKKDIIIQLIKDKIMSHFSSSPINIIDIGCRAGLLLNSLAEFGQVTGIVRMVKKVFHVDKDSNLELSIPPFFINEILYKLFHYEYKFIKIGKRFPFGLSLIAVIKKNQS